MVNDHNTGKGRSKTIKGIGCVRIKCARKGTQLENFPVNLKNRFRSCQAVLPTPEQDSLITFGNKMKPGRNQLKTNFKKIKSLIFILGINNETNSRGNRDG